MRFIHNTLKIAIVWLAVFIPSALLFAQINTDTSGDLCDGGFCNPLSFNTLAGFLESILEALVIIAFPIIVLFLVYAGFLFVSAQGNEEKITKAKRVFLWTVVGALLILGAWTLSKAIEGTIDDILLGIAVQHTHLL